MNYCGSRRKKWTEESASDLRVCKWCGIEVVRLANSGKNQSILNLDMCLSNASILASLSDLFQVICNVICQSSTGNIDPYSTFFCWFWCDWRCTNKYTPHKVISIQYYRFGFASFLSITKMRNEQCDAIKMSKQTNELERKCKRIRGTELESEIEEKSEGIFWRIFAYSQLQYSEYGTLNAASAMKSMITSQMRL